MLALHSINPFNDKISIVAWRSLFGWSLKINCIIQPTRVFSSKSERICMGATIVHVAGIRPKSTCEVCSRLESLVFMSFKPLICTILPPYSQNLVCLESDQNLLCLKPDSLEPIATVKPLNPLTTHITTTHTRTDYITQTNSTREFYYSFIKRLCFSLYILI